MIVITRVTPDHCEYCGGHPLQRGDKDCHSRNDRLLSHMFWRPKVPRARPSGGTAYRYARQRPSPQSAASREGPTGTTNIDSPDRLPTRTSQRTHPRSTNCDAGQFQHCPRCRLSGRTAWSSRLATHNDWHHTISGQLTRDRNARRLYRPQRHRTA